MVKTSKINKITNIPFRLIILFFQKSAVLSAVACRLTKLTRKSSTVIHPKHLLPHTEDWFADHIVKKDIVLDVGSHKGEITFKIAKKCSSIIGIDYDKKLLKEAEGLKNRK